MLDKTPSYSSKSRSLSFTPNDLETLEEEKIKDRNFELAKSLAEINSNHWACINYKVHSRYAHHDSENMLNDQENKVPAPSSTPDRSPTSILH